MNNLLKVFIAFGILVLLTGYGYSQKPPVKFGEVSLDELNMAKYDKEPDAPAVVLSDFCTVSFDYVSGDFRINYDHLCRIKIFTKEGYDWASYTISLYKDPSTNRKEAVAGLKGFTYNIDNGKIVKIKLDKSAVFTENVNKNWDRMKFTMPEVKEGSVIEFSYSKTSDFLGSIDTWTFQKSIPVAWSELYVGVPEYYNYLHISSGYENFAMVDQKKDQKTISVTYKSSEEGWAIRHSTYDQASATYTVTTDHWLAKDMPSLKDEKFVGNLNDFRQKMEFQLASTKFNDQIKNQLDSWETIDKKLIEDIDMFGPNMVKKGFYQEVLDTLLNNKATPSDKALAITAFVQNKTKWDETYDYIPDKTIKKTYDDGVGSSAEINALLVSMLRAAGIDAEPVIISTRENGLVNPMYPLLNKFNNLIAAAWTGDKIMLLDATDPDVPAGMLPDNCLNGTGRCISLKHNTWVDLVPVKSFDEVTTADLKISGDKVTGIVNIKESGYAAIDSKSSFRKDGEDKYLENLKKENPGIMISDHSFDNSGGVSGNFKEKFSVESTNGLTNTGNIIYVNPVLMGQFTENPLKSEDRKFPVDFGAPTKQKYFLKLAIPQGYTVEELPKSVQYAIPDKSSSFKYMASVTDSIIQVTTSLEINKGFYLAQDYKNLREFFSQVVQKNNEQIVLKKKEE